MEDKNLHSKFGKFDGNVVTKWLRHDGADRNMELVEPFAFIRTSGEIWDVPIGTKVNGASIPSIFWSSVGPPFVGNYRRATVVHDHYTEEKTRPSWQTHRVFYEGCRVDGVEKNKAKIMFLAVLLGGGSWTKAEKEMQVMSPAGILTHRAGELIEVPPYTNQTTFDELSAWIAENDPSVEEIEQRCLEYRALNLDH